MKPSFKIILSICLALTAVNAIALPNFTTQPTGKSVSLREGMAFDVQSSTDLGQWSPVTTMTNLTGTLEFADPNATNDSRRFYRTVLR